MLTRKPKTRVKMLKSENTIAYYSLILICEVESSKLAPKYKTFCESVE
jgi:hypothetical protein